MHSSNAPYSYWFLSNASQIPVICEASLRLFLLSKKG
jgi:hypothetical protein